MTYTNSTTVQSTYAKYAPPSGTSVAGTFTADSIVPPGPTRSSNPPRVSYHYHPEIGQHTYGSNHFMKPARVRMTHSLITAYGLQKNMLCQTITPASFMQLTKFHADDYIAFLRSVTSDNAEDKKSAGTDFNMGEASTDCPIWDGVYDFSALSAGGSIDAAARLNSGTADIAINWGGGLHHAKKRGASGFCYVNDIVLAILELLRVHDRVLYIDTDVHHGDGVEEAFYCTDRVMTVSFHKFGEFFPGTGSLNDIGYGRGKHYSVNVPLNDGIDDDCYMTLFRAIITGVMTRFRPSAVVLQLGADSLAGDRLGCFNLSSEGHSASVAFLKSFNVPLLLLGGGGYTVKNVARLWCRETAVACGVDVDDMLPFNRYMESYGPKFRLSVPATNMENLNSREYLQNIQTAVLESLRHIPHAPSAPHNYIPAPLDVDEPIGSSDEDSGDDERRELIAYERKIVSAITAYSTNARDEETWAAVHSRLGRGVSAAATANARRLHSEERNGGADEDGDADDEDAGDNNGNYGAGSVDGGGGAARRSEKAVLTDEEERELEDDAMNEDP